jgi:hypothetical protein
MQPSTSKAPSTASASAHVERCVLWLGLCTTPTAVDRVVVVVGAVASGVVGAGAVVLGTVVVGVVVVGVVVGATVPG